MGETGRIAVGIPALVQGITGPGTPPHLSAASISDEASRQLAAEAKYPIISADPAILALKHELAVVANTESTVLISGESGSGKELFARHLHLISRRGPVGKYVAITCASLPGDLADSHLFGHLRGSYTGAHLPRTGFFRTAEHGTLLLDDVTTLALPIQAKLLRALQEREIVPVGADKPVPVDVRVIAATSKDVLKLVESGAFLEDLYYRLNQYPLPVPPLRDRLGDLPNLVRHFCSRQPGLEHYDGAETPIVRMLTDAQWPNRVAWPGNVRQLESVVTRACILSRIAGRSSPGMQDFKLALDREAGVQPSTAHAFHTSTGPNSGLPPRDAGTNSNSLRTSLGRRSTSPRIEDYLLVKGTLLETVLKFPDINWGHWKGRLLAAATGFGRDIVPDFEQAQRLGIGAKELARMKGMAKGTILETAQQRGLRAGFEEIVRPGAEDLQSLTANLPDLNLARWKGRLVAAAIYQSREGQWQGRDRCELLGIHKTLGTRLFKAISVGAQNQSERLLVEGFDQIDQELMAVQGQR
ncbi:MAG: sigma 54-interacting transcriptional regulator [Oligoflexia bacterium]|nr:sigma 54-interacting transcriptional regulator [Oligoflexia bacterium]